MRPRPCGRSRESSGARVQVEIKFCGMTRAQDAQLAAALGASYVGVIFAGGPRHLDPQRAAEVLQDVPAAVKRVGVFDRLDVERGLELADRLELGAIQLHGGCDDDGITRLRSRFDGEIWAVLRLANGELPPTAAMLFEVADAVVLDAHVPGRLGGTGVTLPWQDLVAAVNPLRGQRARLVLAGGLHADNVREAIELLRPDVVDVSSGVEAAPGIKDHTRMRAFRDAVRDDT
jgi:phosphoribosylanthranilate isomerase